jgi:hypothetical protein
VVGALVDTGRVRRALVRALAVTDAAIDEVLYRPAVVKAFARLSRWWNCDLARLSMRLDDRWGTGYWDEAGIAPGAPCDARGRRAAILWLVSASVGVLMFLFVGLVWREGGPGYRWRQRILENFPKDPPHGA